MAEMTEMMKKYTTRGRHLEWGPNGRYIRIYYRGRFEGCIWNTDRIITIDGEKVVSSDFFN